MFFFLLLHFDFIAAISRGENSDGLYTEDGSIYGNANEQINTHLNTFKSGSSTT